MKIKTSAFTAMVALALLVTSCPSLANIRAPMRSDLPPSSALFSPSRHLTVLHEDLQFECDSTGCQVSATYRVRSTQPATLKMSFISPSSHVENVTVNEADAKPGGVLVARFIDYLHALPRTAEENYQRNLYNEALTEEASKLNVAADNYHHIMKLIWEAPKHSTPEYQQLIEKSTLAEDELQRLSSMYYYHGVELFGKLTTLPRTAECQSLPPDLSTPNGWGRYVTCLLVDTDPNYGWELYQYNFDAAILSGENTLQVRYYQPYSSVEPYVSYFSTASPRHYVSYELWPLKEWHLDPGFKIDLTVKFHNPRHGFMYLKRGGLSVFAGRFMELDGGFGLTGIVGNSRNLPPNTLEQMPGDTLVYRTLLQGDISDRLFIITGENE